MNWYYLNEAGEVVGPVSESTLAEMRSINLLAESTLVCREGTEDWISLAELLGIDTTTTYKAVNPAPEVKATSKANLPMHKAKNKSLILAAVGGLVAVILGVVFVTKNADQEEAASPSEQIDEEEVAAVTKEADHEGVASPIEQMEAKTDSEKYLIKIKPAFKNAVKQEEIVGRPVNGYYIYFRKGEAKPFTGYAVDRESYFFRLMDGVVQEQWQVGVLFPLHLRHAIYRKPKQGESLRSDFDDAQGVVSVKVWKPTGDRCRDTNVENGKGTEMHYGTRVQGESEEMARPSSMTRYEYGKGNYVFLPAKVEPPKSKSINLMTSEDFDMGFQAGAIGKNLPFTNREAYLEGRKFGEKASSMPAYTQGYNQGKEHGLQKITRRSNPFNKISQKVEWLAWDHGYSIGNLEGQISR
jgi:hypothetical protein